MSSIMEDEDLELQPHPTEIGKSSHFQPLQTTVTQRRSSGQGQGQGHTTSTGTSPVSMSMSKQISASSSSPVARDVSTSTGTPTNSGPASGADMDDDMICGCGGGGGGNARSPAFLSREGTEESLCGSFATPTSMKEKEDHFPVSSVFSPDTPPVSTMIGASLPPRVPTFYNIAGQKPLTNTNKSLLTSASPVSTSGATTPAYTPREYSALESRKKLEEALETARRAQEKEECQPWQEGQRSFPKYIDMTVGGGETVVCPSLLVDGIL